MIDAAQGFMKDGPKNRLRELKICWPRKRGKSS